MNSDQQRRGWYDYLRSIDSLLSTTVPLPTFLTTPIPIPKLGYSINFGRSSNTRVDQLTKKRNGQFLFQGLLENGQTSRLAIDGKDFEVDSNTWIIGTVEIGAIAKVKGMQHFDKKVAQQIVILKSPERQ